MSTTPAPIKQHTGRGIPVHGNDIDTDRIIPARFMRCVTFEGLGEYAFFDERYDRKGDKKGHPFNDPRFEGSDILIGNKNFGCGSSREHAPQSLADWGIKAVIGESFAEIFAGNCTAMGIPAVTLSEADVHTLQKMVEDEPSLPITINVETSKVSVGGKTFTLDMNESYRKSLLDGTWDSTAILLQGEKERVDTEKGLPYLSGYR